MIRFDEYFVLVIGFECSYRGLNVLDFAKKYRFDQRSCFY